MTAENTSQLFRKHFKNAILLGLLLGAVSFLVLITTQKSFRSTTDLLIVQNQEGSVDYYTMSRSADYLGGIITESIYSEKFLNEMFATGKISSQLLPNDKKQKLNNWKRMINVEKNSNVGILNIEIFGDTQNQIKEVADGVLEVLINKNSLFLGKGQNLEIRVLSGPIIEKNPSIQQIVLASSGGFLIGIVLVFLFVFYWKEFFEKEEIETNEIFRVNNDNHNIFTENNNAVFENSLQNLHNLESSDSYKVNEDKKEEIQDKLKISNPEYFSEDSDYWKVRLQNQV